MAIQYSGSVVYTQIDGSSVASIISDLSAALVSAGWTADSATPASKIFTFTGEPANNETIALIGPSGTRTYTFKTTLTGAADEIHRGGSATQDAINLREAITAGSGAGTDYGTGTVANVDFTATDNGSGAITIKSIASLDGNRYRVTNSLSNTSPAGGTTYELTASSQVLTCAATPQGLQMRVRLVSWNQGTAAAGIVAGSVDGSLEDSTADTTNMMALQASASRTLEVFADPYWFFVWLLGSKSTAGTEVGAGTLFVDAAEAPSKINSVSGTGNGNGWHQITVGDTTHFTEDDTSIVIETTAAHGYSTGDHVFVDGVPDAATWSSGGVVADQFQTSRAIWSMASDTANTSSYRPTWRNNLSAHNGKVFVVYNQYSWGGLASNPLPFMLPITVSNASVDMVGCAPNIGNRWDITEPRVAWSISAYLARTYIVGQLPDAFITTAFIEGDQVDTIDGHQWISLTDSYRFLVGNMYMTGSLFVAKT